MLAATEGVFSIVHQQILTMVVRICDRIVDIISQPATEAFNLTALGLWVSQDWSQSPGAFGLLSEQTDASSGSFNCIAEAVAAMAMGTQLKQRNSKDVKQCI